MGKCTYFVFELRGKLSEVDTTIVLSSVLLWSFDLLSTSLSLLIQRGVNHAVEKGTSGRLGTVEGVLLILAALCYEHRLLTRAAILVGTNSQS